MVYFTIFLLALLPTNSQQFSFTNAWQKFFYKFSDQYNNTQKSVFKRQTGNETQKQLCDENKLMIQIAALQVVSPDRMITMLSTDNIIDFCRRIEMTIAVNAKEEKHCKTLPRDNLYVKLLQGFREFSDMICNDKRSKKAYLKFETCYNELKEELIDCEGPNDWFEETNSTLACRYYEEIINCDYVKIAKLCGTEAAHLMFMLAKKVFNAVIEHNCKMTDKEPNVPDAMALSGAQMGKTSKYILLLCSVLSVRILV